MGVFVAYEPLPYANLANTPTTILSTGIGTYPHTIIVNGICVTNTTNQSIRFNLKKNRVQASPVNIFKIKEFEVKAYQTIDVVDYLGLQLVLKYSVDPSITENLTCFSTSVAQTFDCEVTFTVLNETPVY